MDYFTGVRQKEALEISELSKRAKPGQRVKVNGAVHAIRDMGTQWPGRVGRFIGYRIVQAYLTRHPETKLNELLSPTFYTSSMTLPDSGY